MSLSQHLLMQPIPLLYQPMKVLWLFMSGMVGLVTFAPKAYSQSAKSNFPSQIQIPGQKTDTSLVKPPSAKKIINIPSPISKYSLFNPAPIPSLGKSQVVKPKLSNAIKFSGSFSVESVYNSWQDPYSRLPNQYTRYAFSPVISVMGLPIKTNFVYSTASGLTNRPFTSFSLGLDTRTAQQTLISGIDKRQNELKRIESNIATTGGTYLKLPNNSIPSPNSVEYTSPGQSFGNFPSFPDYKDIQLNNSIALLDKLDPALKSRFMDSVSRHAPAALPGMDTMVLFQKMLNEKNPDARQQMEDSLEKNHPEQYNKYKSLQKIRSLEKFRQGNLQNSREQLLQSPLLSKSQRALMAVRRFNIGDNYGDFTQFTLNGLRVTGIDIAYSPGKLYTALTAGTSKLIQYGGEGTYTIKNKNILVSTVGYGAKTDNHIHFTWFTAGDRPSGLFDKSSTFATNTVISSDFLVKYHKWLKWEGEAAKSWNQPGSINTSTTSLEAYYSAHPPQNKPLFRDIAWRSKLSFIHEKTKTTLSGEIKQIGPGFYSTGVPYLRSNLLSYKIKLQKSFYKKQVSMETYWTKENSNTTNYLDMVSKSQAVGATLSLLFKKMPYFIASYFPFSQENRIKKDSFGTTNTFQAVMLMSGYQFYIDRTIVNTQLNYLSQKELSQSDGAQLNRQSISLYEIVKFGMPFQWVLTYSYYFPEPEINIHPATNLNSCLTYTYKEKYDIGAGISRSEHFIIANKESLYLTGAFKITKHQFVSLRAGLGKQILSDGPLNGQPKTFEGSLKYNLTF